MEISYIKISILILSFCLIKAFNQLPLTSVVEQINQEFRIDLNVVVNFNAANDTTGRYYNLLTSSSKPLIVFTKINKTTTTITTPIHYQQTKNLLIIVWLNADVATWHDIIKFLDQLLWKLHWTEILFVQETNYQESNNLRHLFQQCWLNGFINVLLWQNGLLYTYHPFPQPLTVKQLANVALYMNKNHLKDFQGHKLFVLLRKRTPRCYSYRNRRGQEILAGYWYKIVETFIEHYNGSIHNRHISEAETQTIKDIFKVLNNCRYDFVPNVLYFSDAYANSDIFYISKIVVISASPMEISESLYLVLIFDLKVWLMCLCIFAVLSVLIAGIYKYLKNHWDFYNACLDALKTMLNIYSSNINQRSLLLFILHFLPLLCGFLLTNFHNCNLYSMRTAKIFEPPLIVLRDILKTNKMILESTIDVNKTLSMDIVPDYLKKRLVTVDQFETFDKLRSNLKVSTYFFTGADDLVEYYLFQQKYLSRPFATTLSQPLLHRPFFIALPHRSPFLPHFNRYVLYVHENGLYAKLKKDAKWDGVMSGDIKFFVDSAPVKPLCLNYFLSAFIILFVGLIGSIIAFLFEVYSIKKKSVK